MQIKSIAECSKGSILQYFQPSLSYQLNINYSQSLYVQAAKLLVRLSGRMLRPYEVLLVIHVIYESLVTYMAYKIHFLKWVKCTDGMANSIAPDQTTSSSVWSVITLLSYFLLCKQFYNGELKN